MKIKYISIFILGLALGALSFSFLAPKFQTSSPPSQEEEAKQLYSCGMHPEVISDKPGNCPICGMKLTPIKGASPATTSPPEKKEKKILYWRAPMDPTEIYDRPGKSKMGMDLIPVYEGEEGAGIGTITIDGAIQQNMNLRLSKVEKMPLQRTIRALGKITFAQDKEYTVTTKISGWVEKLYVNTEGEIVHRGQPLLKIYSPELVSTQEELLLAIKNYERVAQSPIEDVRRQAQQLVELTKKRLKLWDISDEEIETIINSKKIQRTITLRAQAKGVVTHKNIKEGDRVSPGKPLLHIAEIDKVWVEATVYESELPLVQEGQSVEITLDHLPDKKFKGKIELIYPYLEAQARAGRVRLILNNSDYLLKPGMDATVKIHSLLGAESLAVPSEAVIRTGERNIVFVAREEGKFEPREVKVGVETDDGYLQIISGLFEGEQVVTSGQFLLDSESRTREAIAKLRSLQQQKPSSSEEPSTPEHRPSSTEGSKTPPKEHTHQESLAHQEKSPSTAGTLPISLEKLYACPMHPHFLTTDPEARCPECGMKLVPALEIKEKIDLHHIEFYTCPMHPEFLTTDSAARCPECGMKLEKVTKK